LLRAVGLLLVIARDLAKYLDDLVLALLQAAELARDGVLGPLAGVPGNGLPVRFLRVADGRDDLPGLLGRELAELLVLLLEVVHLALGATPVCRCIGDGPSTQHDACDDNGHSHGPLRGTSVS